jgi:ornithine cyclodeaminase/alanine dehydrogenase-like protein (mu-crystallin family)
MALLILSQSEVEQLLPIEECIPVMEQALAALARGEVYQPLRQVIRAPNAGGFLGLMPAHWHSYGLKAVCVFPENPKRGLDTHLGAVLLYDGATGGLLAVMNASAITAIRTAAVTAVATKLLAREDAAELAMVGSGVQARAHLLAMAAVRPIRSARIAGKQVASASRMAREMSERVKFPLHPAGSVEEAVRGASLIVTATSSHQPVLRREWISAGAHINLVGSSIPSAREADGPTMKAGSLFVDRRESTLNESGDYLYALREGAIAEDHIRAEIGEVLTGSKKGRGSRDEITIFKSLGLAVEDLASAAYLYEKAQSSGVGSRVDFD